MKKIIILAIAASLAGCSTKSYVQNYEEEKILATASNKEQPEWADDTKVFWIEGGKVRSLGITQIRGDERPEAGARIAQNNARANISKAIENRMEFIFQGSEENASYDSTVAKYIGSEVSSLTTHSLRPEAQWWKRFEQSQEDGSRRIFYKIYALETMPEADFKRAVFAAINKVDNHKLSASFQKQVDRQWGRFVEGDTHENKKASNKEEPVAETEESSLDN